MSKSTGIAALLTFVVASALTSSPPRAQERLPRPSGTEPIAAITAPPLIQSQGGKTPVTLRSATMSVETDGGLARTVVELTLFNPNDTVLEGNLQFPLQPGQQVSAFALDIGDEMREAVPVPKQKAQQVFESIERRNVDPGLLEQTAGNHFRLRVYPIPAHGTRRARVTIDEALARDGDAWRLDVPVQILTDADLLSLSVRARGIDAKPTQSGSFDALKFERARGGYAATHEVLRERVSNQAPRRLPTLRLRLPAASTPQAFIQRFDGERFAMIELPMSAAPSAPRRIPKAVGLLWDASASARERDRASEFALLNRYFAAMGDGRVSLRLLRDTGEDAGAFEIRGGDWSALRAVLEKAIYDGASDLADWAPKAEIGEYLLVSDGLRTYGDAPFPTLAPGQALYALSSAGAKTDAARLTAVTGARGGRSVQWQGRGGVEEAARALLDSGTRIVALEGEGIEDLQPQSWDVDGGLLRIAGRMTDDSASVKVTLREGGKTRSLNVPIASDASESDRVAALWGAWRIAARAEQPERHRAEIARMGQRFGVVTPGTSLLVLEAAEDYVRYDIPAPAALRERVAMLKQQQGEQRERTRSDRIEEIAARFAQRVTWWERDYPKTPPAPAKDDRQQIASDAENRGYLAADAPAPAMAGAPPPPPPAPPPAGAPEASSELDSVAIAGARNRREEAESPAALAKMVGTDASKAGQGVSIRLQPWESDSPYARRLRDAAPEDVYAFYLDERDSHAGSTAFYLDVGDILLRKGRRAEALRVLSNLAEMELENRHILRVLGYRLMQAKDWNRAAEMFRDVLRLAEEEPQSHRDLGLALAAAGERQEAIERLYEVIVRPWDGRFSEVDAVVLNELNAIVATSPKPLNTDFIDARLLKNMPLDLRAVLAWDSDNSDMDLWVTDPNGERCYYGHRNTYQGGLLSDDFTGGYGPEEFVLKDAKPGKYKVEANFFGDRQQIVTGATTLSLTLSTGWGTKRQQDQTVTLRLSGKSETVLVGEFEVR
ncbi:MAG: DUF2135 domain-containing protein [Xanthomonadaceae bacterium]|nr:DUF2135 domain-containing protein [Xanthomonadaceae bacterium]